MAIEIKDEFEESAVDESSETVIQEEASYQEPEETVDDSEDEIEEETEEPDEIEEEPVQKEEIADEEEVDEDVIEESSQESGNPEESGQESQQTGKPEKKSLFGKKKDKKDKRDEKIDELTDLLKRNMAEFDNFRKRTDKEKATMYDMGARSIVEKLLPVVDNFERGLATVTEEEKTDNSFANGMDLVYKQILKLFEDIGVEVIETEGKEFDPNLHNAVMHIEDENLGENVIAQEFQKGYTYKGTVIRHSMVQVAN